MRVQSALTSLILLTAIGANAETVTGKSTTTCGDAFHNAIKRILPEIDPGETPKFLPSYSVGVREIAEGRDTACEVTLNLGVDKAPSVKQEVFSKQIQSDWVTGQAVKAESDAFQDAIYECGKANTDTRYGDDVVRRYSPIHSESIDAVYSRGNIQLTRRVTCALSHLSFRAYSDQAAPGEGATEEAACKNAADLFFADASKKCEAEGMSPVGGPTIEGQRTSYRQSRGTWLCSAWVNMSCEPRN